LNAGAEPSVKLPPSAAKKSPATACARHDSCFLSAAPGPPPWTCSGQSCHVLRPLRVASMADAAALIVGEAGQAGARLVGQALHDDAHVAQRRRDRGAARRRVIPAARRAALGQVVPGTCMRSHGGIGATCLYPPSSCYSAADLAVIHLGLHITTQQTSQGHAQPPCHCTGQRGLPTGMSGLPSTAVLIRTDASTLPTRQKSTTVQQPGMCH